MFKNLAAPFLDETRQLDDMRSQLSLLRAKAPGTHFPWTIAPRDALKTIPSRGKYQKGKKRGLKVVGELSFIWEVRSDPQDNSILELIGNASTSVRISEVGGDLVAQWNLDVGVSGSPGCHFHAQRPEPKGKSIDVPRLPVPFVLPLDGLDFMLGEMFQDDWPQKSAQRTTSFQLRRFEDMLAWISASIQGNKAPWVKLKASKPSAADFRSNL